MSSKPPSSLDYDAFLHELALKNWRRALAAGDIPRAEANAARLTESSDRLWRYVGFVQLSISQASRGRASAALEALAKAIDACQEKSELAAGARCLAAHVHLETHSPRQALRILGELDRTAEAHYFRALALARAGHIDDARAELAALKPAGSGTRFAFREHIESELSPDTRLPHLERAVDAVSAIPCTSSLPAVPIRFAHGEALADEGRFAEARSAFGDIISATDAILFWPIPYVRSLYRRGTLDRRLGDHARARDDFVSFLKLWGDGEMDRDAVRDAAQFMKS